MSFTTKRPNFPHMPSSSSTDPQLKYDVFLSFRGEDTRNSFTSFLYDALKRNQILTFIDNKLVRGDEISPSLLKAIEESKLSVIIFSENYASSKWCLEELAKILECRKNNGQIVIPVFYEVDPSDVRKQTGMFGDAFDGLVKEKALTRDQVKSFRDALKDASNLSGLCLGNSELQSEFVGKVARDILSKLHKMSLSHTMGLVGIDARVQKIEALLNINSQDVRIVGIWGMGGIGKTTIAKAVCDNNQTQFEGIFFENFREELKRHSMADLRRSFLLKLLGPEILDMGYLSFQNFVIKERLHRKKVLLVLDNVDGSVPLQEWQEWKELLSDRHRSFGPGSKILVTSRDKQVLNNVTDEIYEVESLKRHDALELFSLNAFKNGNPSIGERELSERVVNNARGNPLALIVLGSALYGKSKEEWCSALNKLALGPQMENVLRISYDELSHEEKTIFLDIAFFLRGWERNNATRILDGPSMQVPFSISNLIDKCLITVFENKLEMHDSLQEMAFRIVGAESKHPGKRSRLRGRDEVIHVLKNKKGTEEIEGISLDMSKLSRNVHLEPDAFARMDRIRFLKFYYPSGFDTYNNVEGHLLTLGDLEYLPDELRYLKWDRFPLNSLPQNFNAENLMELHFTESKLEKLWSGVQDLVNLTKIDLSDSRRLTELPDLSKANNLVSIDLNRCESLIELPSSVQYLEKLERLHLAYCYNLTSLPTRIDSKVLSHYISTLINEVPEIVSTRMEVFWLSETSINEVPRSITSTLELLVLSGCSNITKFPDVSRDIKNLHLSGTSIEEVPSSIQFLTRLEILAMSGCSKLQSFPEITEPMNSLTFLDLRGTGIKELPSSIKNLISLKFLEINGMPIKELPELPSSLCSLTAKDCASLETLSTIHLSDLRLDFSNCFKLDQKALIADILLRIQAAGQFQHFWIGVVLPGSEIPEWFSYQEIGSSVTVQLPSNYHHQLKGFAFCLVFLLPIPSDKYFYAFTFDCHVKSKKGEHDDVIFETKAYPNFKVNKPYDSDHTFLTYKHRFGYKFSKYYGNEVTFEFYPKACDYRGANITRRELEEEEVQKHCKLKRCGVHLLYDEDINELKSHDQY